MGRLSLSVIDDLRALLDKAEVVDGVPVAEVGDASYYDGEEISTYKPNGNLVIEHGLDYYAGEITKLPIGTKLYTTPQPSRIKEIEALQAREKALVEALRYVNKELIMYGYQYESKDSINVVLNEALANVNNEKKG